MFRLVARIVLISLIIIRDNFVGSDFQCYKCDNKEDCNKAIDQQQLVTCGSQECCYVAHVREKPHEPFYAKRDCVQSLESTCKSSATEHQVEFKFYQKFPAGTLLKTIVCTASDTNCNGAYYSTEPQKCYTCTKCNSIPPNVKPMPCELPDICFTEYTTKAPDEQTFARRGCSKELNWTVTDEATHHDDQVVCSKLRTDFLAKNKNNGEYVGCHTCESEPPMVCNGVDFDPYADIRITRPAVLCYDCHDCNVVTADTKVTECWQDSCCYQAAVRSGSDQQYSTTRGCLRDVNSCDHACDEARKLFIAANFQASFGTCVACAKGSGDLCNYADYPPVVIPEIVRKPIMCYDCVDCFKVNDTTPNTYCKYPSCCYVVALAFQNGSKYLQRGCHRVYEGEESKCSSSCLYFGNEVTVGECEPCGAEAADGCNGISKPIITEESSEVAGSSSSIACYHCDGCDSTYKPHSTVSKCEDAECCYRMLVRYETHEWDTVRGCAALRSGQSCEKTCEYEKSRHRSAFLNGLVHVCTQCEKGDGDLCNNRPYHGKVTEPPPRLAIKCYECNRNCDTVTIHTPTVTCREASCCYSALLRDTPDGDQYVIRGCSRWQRGGNCSTACSDVKRIYLWDEVGGAFVNCKPCPATMGNKCNSHTFQMDKQVAQAKQLVGINCYYCRMDMDCYEVNKDTNTMSCPAAGCCYTARVKNREDNYYYQVERGCAAPDTRQSCDATCKDFEEQYLFAHVNGQFIDCIPCMDHDTDLCNSIPYTTPEIAVVPDGEKYIWCHHCIDRTNCDVVGEDSIKIKCPIYLKCYIALVTRNEGGTKIYAMRGCERSREIFEKNHSNNILHYWMECYVDTKSGCNNLPYNRAPITMRSLFTCHECEKCDKCELDTTSGMKTCGSTNCEDGPKCCYTSIVKEKNDDLPFIKRGCISNCTDACAEMKSTYMRDHMDGNVEFCHTCLDDDSLGRDCNDKEHVPQTTPAN